MLYEFRGELELLTTPPDPGVLHLGEYPQFVFAMRGFTVYPHLFLKMTGVECLR